MTNPTRPPLPLPAPPPLPVPDDFSARAVAIGVTLDDAALGRIGDYLARLLAMNEHVNLTAIKDPEDAWTRHALDALSLLPGLAHLPAGARVVDVGSGGGLPAIILAIARPDLAFSLVESTAKKAAFLTGVSEALGLTNVTVHAERAENLLKAGHAQQFDAATARAVARLDTLLKWTAPFVRPGGRLLLVKGEQANAELVEAHRIMTRLRCSHIRTVTTPTGRILVIGVN